MQNEAMEIVVSGIDKFQATKNYEAMAQLIKGTMDKKFGSSWHVAIGEGYNYHNCVKISLSLLTDSTPLGFVPPYKTGFGFDVTYQSKNMIYVYYGNVGILCYKC